MPHIGPIRRLLAAAVAVTMLVVVSETHAQSAKVTVDAGQPGATVSSNLFGIFFEEINFGGEGGLYAELIRNRTLGNSANPDYWTLVTTGTAAGQVTTDTSFPLNANNTRSLKLTLQSGTGKTGVANSGYWGIPLVSGALYDLSFYARTTNSFSGLITFRLESANGSTVYAQTNFAGLSTNWKQFSVSLTPSASDTNARMLLSIDEIGTVWLDEISLKPRATFNNRTNGLRPDLANLLADLRPSFLRFPGGCYVEGNYLTNAFNWKRSIGDPATRPGHWNGVWGYFSTDGLGFHEYLQLAEDIGATPLFGINAGMAHNEVVPLADMQPYVQAALDAIEYANGDTNTTWGALRAANGHPAPFNLKFIEIGNENGGANYNDRYALFYDAIKAAHPDVKIIACVWGGTPSSRPFDLMDEHYYTGPATMASYATKYDTYSRNGPKVFVGEYAGTSGYGTFGNLAAALGEAAFMTGLERNSDVVEIASYAPLFANVNGMQWHPNLINFDNSRCFGTPAYYVQKIFSRNRGDVVLPLTVSAPVAVTNPPPRGSIGLGSWSTSVEYTNVLVTSNGVTLYQSDFAGQGTNGWRVYAGNWNANAGIYSQSSDTLTDCRSTTGNTSWSNYTLTLRARKLSGSEGFLILFNWLDDGNWTWLNLGGWGNTLHGVENCVNGSKTTLGTRSSGNIATGRWYDIKIILTGFRVQCYLDGALVQDVTYPVTSTAGLYASSTYDQNSRQIVIKTVNPNSVAMPTEFTVNGIAVLSSNATLIQLTSGSPADENTLAAPTRVFPTTNLFYNASTNFALTLPANSLSVLRLQLQTALPPAGLKAATDGWHVLLSWSAYPGATNYIIKRAAQSGGPYTVIGHTSGTSFLDTSAPLSSTQFYVLAAQFPSGMTPDTAEVSASIGSTPHVYLPCDATSGTIAVDATGHGWNGSLLNGATWVAGQSNNAVRLSGSSQYVSLPTGIMTNLTDFSVTAWVNLNAASTWSRIFDFGSGTGTYMFLTPRSGAGTVRYAITTTSNGGEQQINGPSALSTGAWHHVAITLTGSTGLLYIDGAAVGTNSAMTLAPAALGSTTQNWIGRSQWAADPYLNGIVDEFRIYRGTLSAGEVATFLSPLSAPAGLTATPDDSQVRLTWNAVANANGYNIKRSTSNAGPYSVIASNVVGVSFVDTTAQNGTNYFYVISAVNAVGSSGDSLQASARPVSQIPPACTFALNGNRLQFNWPATHTGWRLQAQTNSLGTNWFTIPESVSVNSWATPIDPAISRVFFRLVYP